MAVTINADTSNGLVMTPDTSGEIKLQSAGADTVTVDSSGNVGIGTTSPTEKLDVNGTANATNITRGGSQVYSRDNILGTVSQSGGVPTGQIIQRGSNANGNYVKYADGTMICNIILSAATSSTWTFPVSFSSSPTVQATNAAGNSSRFCSIGTPSTTSVAVYRWTYQGTASTTIAHMLAIGTWY